MNFKVEFLREDGTIFERAAFGKECKRTQYIDAKRRSRENKESHFRYRCFDKMTHSIKVECNNSLQVIYGAIAEYNQPLPFGSIGRIN